MSKPRNKYNVIIKFEGEDLEAMEDVMNYYRISNGKDLLMHLVVKEYREIQDKKGDHNQKSNI